MIEALSLAQVKGVLAHAPVLFFIIDREYRFRAVAGAQAIAFRLAGESATGASALEYFKKQQPAHEIESAFALAREGHRSRFQFSRRGAKYEAYLYPIHENDGTSVIAGVAIESESRTSAELLQVHRVLAHAEAISTLASYTVDLETESCEITPGFARLLGFPEETRRVHLGEIVARIHPEDRIRFTRARAAALATSGDMNIEYRFVRPSGEIRYVHAYASVFTNESGKPVRGVGVIYDETQARETELGLEYISIHDPLTGSLNRTAFDRRVRGAVAESEANHRGVAVLFLDIDAFGEVNDLAGHSTGDQILRVVAERLRAVHGLEDSVGRMGGDEFALLFAGVEDNREAEAHVAEVRNSLRAPIMVSGTEYNLTASIGVAMFNIHETEAALLTRAHMAMLSAKAAGRSRVMWYTPDLERLMTMRHRLERDLNASLDRNELVVHYQPIYDARTSEMTAVEALLRWNHPELGTIAPTGFLDVASQTGQLIFIGDWVLRRACRDAVELSKRFGQPIRININVSPEQLQTADFADRVFDIAREIGIDASLVQIEVTEQSLINDIEHAALMLGILRRHRFSIAIDDFGTGYNSLSYLKSYPVSCIKIDRTFVRDCETDEYSRAICRSIVALGHSLGLLVIGEGVETPGQDAFLREAGCHELQGFLYGKPVPIDELIGVTTI